MSRQLGDYGGAITDQSHQHQRRQDRKCYYVDREQALAERAEALRCRGDGYDTGRHDKGEAATGDGGELWR